MHRDAPYRAALIRDMGFPGHMASLAYRFYPASHAPSGVLSQEARKRYAEAKAQGPCAPK